MRSLAGELRNAPVKTADAHHRLENPRDDGLPFTLRTHDRQSTVYEHSHSILSQPGLSAVNLCASTGPAPITMSSLQPSSRLEQSARTIDLEIVGDARHFRLRSHARVCAYCSRSAVLLLIGLSGLRPEKTYRLPPAMAINFYRVAALFGKRRPPFH